jgi:hypothetical protein
MAVASAHRGHSPAGGEESIGILNRDRADLLKQPELIPTVPTFNDLAAVDSDHYHSGDTDTMPRGGDAKALAGMSAFKDDTDDRFVAFNDGVLDTNMNIGESGPHVPPEDFKTCGAAYSRFTLAKPVCESVRREELIDRLFAAAIPNLIEPAMNQRFCIHCHIASYRGSIYHINIKATSGPAFQLNGRWPDVTP